jgi:hypothetical protein
MHAPLPTGAAERNGVPLRIPADRVGLYGVALILFGTLPALLGHPGDWQRFWAGGATVGTSALFNEGEHLVFQAARGIGTGIWTYPPAFACAFLPAAHLTIAVGYAINFVFMLTLVALSGSMLAGVFGFQRTFGVIAALAWQPAIYSGDVGQVSAVWLLLIAFAMAGAARGSSLIVGFAVGLMLLKPTIALPFVALLLVRRQWQACAIVGICGGAWYLASVAATAGEWSWIPHYIAVIRALHDVDMGAVYNGVTIPMILIRLGTPQALATALGAIAFICFLPALSRVRVLLAMSCTSVFSLAFSAHAWMYDATVVLPALFYAMAKLAEPWRTRLIVAAYSLAALWMPIDAAIRFNPLAIVTLGGAALCAVALYGKVTVSSSSC